MLRIFRCAAKLIILFFIPACLGFIFLQPWGEQKALAFAGFLYFIIFVFRPHLALIFLGARKLNFQISPRFYLFTSDRISCEYLCFKVSGAYYLILRSDVNIGDSRRIHDFILAKRRRSLQAPELFYRLVLAILFYPVYQLSKFSKSTEQYCWEVFFYFLRPFIFSKKDDESIYLRNPLGKLANRFCYGERILWINRRDLSSTYLVESLNRLV